MYRKFFIVLAALLLVSTALKAQNKNDFLNEQLAFLQQMYFENQDHADDDFLVQQFELFLKKHPFYRQNDQILWMYGNLLENKKQIARALFQYLKLGVLFPNSALATEARNRIRQLIDQKTPMCLVDCQEALEAYIDQPHFHENQIEGLFSVFSLIFSQNLSCFDEPLLKELTLFEQSCHEFDYSQDLLLYWKGILLKRMKKYSQAYGHFKKLQHLFSRSSLRPSALFESSFIAYRHLKRFTQARDGFVRLINHFPDDRHSPLAQFYLAELYADTLDSLNAGIDNYRLFLDAFPQHPMHAQAFKRLTFLYLKAQRYEEAITLIGLNLNRHAGDSSMVALVDSMANVFENTFRKYEMAARCYVLLASQLPPGEKTPYYLYRAARIYYKKMKDRARAEDICNRLSENFADTPYAEKCKLLLKQPIKK
ncbi:tetratricopeptide repeat protein [Calditrichota bacterium LG25]